VAVEVTEVAEAAKRHWVVAMVRLLTIKIK
jgi:hypothetical protein